MADASRIDDEAARLTVLEKPARGDRSQPVRTSNDRGEIIHNEPARDATEEGPGSLQAFDDGRQRLMDQRPDEAVPAVRQHNRERPDGVSPPCRRIDQRTEPSEVELRDLTRRGACHAHGVALPAAQTGLAHEPAQAAVRDVDASLGEQLGDARELQVVLEPAGDLLAVRLQDAHAGRSARRRSALRQSRQQQHLFVCRRWPTGPQPQTPCLSDVFANGVPRQPRPANDRPDAFSCLPPAQYFDHLHKPNLPIGHRHPLLGSDGLVFGPQVGQSLMTIAPSTWVNARG